MSRSSERPIYTKSQLSQWLNLVCQGRPEIPLEELEADVKQDPLGALGRIQLWQLAAVPFGNIALHYSLHHVISLDVDAVFAKIVERRLGGYCMENNILLSTVLRSLGYDLYPTGARVSFAIGDDPKDPEGFGGWTHAVNIVSVQGVRYLVDVGFGPSGPIQPLPLQHGKAMPNLPHFEARLVYDPIAPCTDASQRMWIFEVRRSSAPSWVPQYCFAELEFLPQDFVIMNYHISQSRTSWFTQTLVLAKFLLHEVQHEAVGTLTLNGNEIKQRLGGETELIMICATEEERINAIDKYFGVKLRPEEIKGIQGLPSELNQSKKMT